MFHISACGNEAPAAKVSFRNDVMAVLSKAGCNSGACHGNANGKAGFKLSLRGEDADWDFAALTHDQFGRRVNALEPDQSLILLKPTAEIAHEGGLRFKKDAEEYRILKDWIAAGLKRDDSGTPQITGLRVEPEVRYLFSPATNVQINATASFSDGSKRDVHSLAVYEPANNLVKVSA